jgi:hypothetical protein
VVGRFLRQRFGTGAIDPHAITVEDVNRRTNPESEPGSACVNRTCHPGGRPMLHLQR